MKPNNPVPPPLRRVLKQILPKRLYRRYVGRHEDASLRSWAHLAAQVDPQHAILDIGAFHGEYALAARAMNPTAQIFAFEPNPKTVQLLRSACEKCRIEIFDVAVAEENGKLSFQCSDAQSSLLTKGTPDEHRTDVVTVTAVTLDTWTAQHRVIPSLIKIDVEGAEAGILRSAQRTLREIAPIILCEVLTDEAGDAVTQALPDHYLFYYVDENRGFAQKPQITRLAWRNKNWLLVPRQRASELCDGLG